MTASPRLSEEPLSEAVISHESPELSMQLIATYVALSWVLHIRVNAAFEDILSSA